MLRSLFKSATVASFGASWLISEETSSIGASEICSLSDCSTSFSDVSSAGTELSCDGADELVLSGTELVGVGIGHDSSSLDKVDRAPPQEARSMEAAMIGKADFFIGKTIPRLGYFSKNPLILITPSDYFRLSGLAIKRTKATLLGVAARLSGQTN